jgi:hypothetical protein
VVMGDTWSAPRLVGSELIACADSVTPDRSIDPSELVLFATRCFVPAGAHARVAHWMQALVTGCGGV